MDTLFSKDAQQAALGFAIKQQTHIEQGVNEVIYPDIQYPSLIPVDTSANAFAKTITYFSSDKFGKADWINGNSNDVPLAGTELAKHETSVHMAGIGYAWSYEEINQAQMLGANLQNEDAMAARRAYEEMVDRVALTGDAAKGFSGLINNSEVVVEAADTGDWDSATEDQILADVNKALLGSAAATNYTSVADTLVMPNEKLNILATRRLGDTQGTILTFIQMHNTYTAMTGRPLMIRAMRGLEAAGASADARMVAYRRDPSVLKLHIPMPHRFLPVYQDGPLNYVVAGVFRLGGLDIRRPAEVRYVVYLR